MIEPYLIAHLVRGEPAFDIAICMDGPDEDGDEWWIIPTSGHRAYPYWCCLVEELDFLNSKHPNEYLAVCPSDWPDHYPHSASPTPRTTPNLRSLGLAKPQPKIARRI